MKQGEVWTLSSRVRVLVVSNDEFNELGQPLCVPLIGVREIGENPFVVTTTEADNVTGSLLLPEVGRYELAGGARELLISGPTMAAVSAKLAKLFAH